MSKLISRIKSINIEKRTGVIHRINPEDERDFLFVEKQLLHHQLEALTEGMEVQFEPYYTDNNAFANKVEISAHQHFVSTIKSINTEKRNGLIHKLNPTDERDFLFIEKQLVNSHFEELQEGMKVQFEANGYFANQVQVLLSEPSASTIQNDKALKKPSNADSFSKIIETIIESIYQNAVSVTDPFVFEDYTHTILKMLVPEVYPSARDKQAGLFDGLFKYKNLEVIYDCTLSQKYREYKTNQINNYINQIQQQSITINKERINLNNNSIKQIWVITKNKTELLDTYRGAIDIRIKEVSIFSLIELLNKKLINIDYDPLNAIDDLKDIK